MRTVITGSIATDHLMAFPGHFTEQLLPDQLSQLSLSFLVDDLVVRRGGVAANIAFGLGCLGAAPLLVGAVGQDFADYDAWLHRHGVDTTSVHRSTTQHTARFVCTTDRGQNQIASFYAGAMSEARDIELRPTVQRVREPALVVIAANDPDAMLRHTAECRDRGYWFAADPSQQLARLDGEAVRTLVDGATYLFTNAYERTLLMRSTGWTADQVLERVGAWVVTLGEDGARIDRRRHPSLHIPAAPPLQVVDPTGAGDGFRAGFLFGVSRRLGLERSAQLGCQLATLVVETVGTQEYTLDRATFSNRMAKAYGEQAAAEVESVVRI